MSAVQPQDKRLAEAVAVLIEAIHREVPAVVMRPLAPYDDEDFTLEVRIPAGMDRDTVMASVFAMHWRSRTSLAF